MAASHLHPPLSRLPISSYYNNKDGEKDGWWEGRETGSIQAGGKEKTERKKPQLHSPLIFSTKIL